MSDWKELREALAKATAGEWWADGGEVFAHQSDDRWPHVATTWGPDDVGEDKTRCWADGVFIAIARNDLPALLSERDKAVELLRLLANTADEAATHMERSTENANGEHLARMYRNEAKAVRAFLASLGSKP